MGLPNTEKRTLATGYRCILRMGKSESLGKSDEVALVTSFDASEDFQVQDATVIGYLGPISIDPQGYTCSITIASLVPILSEQLYDGANQHYVHQWLPYREDFMADNGMIKIPFMDFVDKTNGVVIAAFRGVIVTSAGTQAEGNTYIRSNVQMRALDVPKGVNPDRGTKR
ncbi:hypothetical protein FACS1894164_12240 [Spirochaetia bacterium]|nr:hypothetical protein FACS1894164_12240 [Spirochaetia bacterium]